MESFVQAAAYVADHAADLVNAALAVVGAASALVALTPAPRVSGWLGRLRAVLETLALNIGHARPEGRAPVP